MPADSHCHLNDPAFDADRGEAIQRALNAGLVHFLNVGYNIPTTQMAIHLAEEFAMMYASAGIHPHNAASVDEQAISEIRGFAGHPKVVAIGETGLDYYRDRSPRDAQARSFRAHIAIARQVGKPIIVHCRDAMEDAMAIMKDERIHEIGGVMHCFAGTPDDVRRLLDMNLYISFAGNITYPNASALRESLMAVPGHRLLLETDSPYLSPKESRGKRNEPASITSVIRQAAQTRGVTVEDMNRISVTNFQELFRVGGSRTGEIVYRIRDSLYVNVTKNCTNECFFCPRFFSDTLQGHNLRLTRDPSVEEMIEAIGDPARYDEIVFCGYGEPTLRLEEIKAVARAIKSKGGATRLNTNGHGSRIAGRDITPELAGLIDHVSVSLNAADKQTYNAICNPSFPDAWESAVDFIRKARLHTPIVTATAVAIPGKVNVEAVRKFVQDGLGVRFRVREFNLVG
jgi:TatD DNase family protein